MLTDWPTADCCWLRPLLLMWRRRWRRLMLLLLLLLQRRLLLLLLLLLRLLLLLMVWLAPKNRFPLKVDPQNLLPKYFSKPDLKVDPRPAWPAARGRPARPSRAEASLARLFRLAHLG